MPVLDVQPAWVKVWTAAEAESDMEGFKFKGPGWYYLKDKTRVDEPHFSILAVPVDRGELNYKTTRTFWAPAYTEQERFEFNVWDFDIASRMALFTSAPNKVDERLL